MKRNFLHDHITDTRTWEQRQHDRAIRDLCRAVTEGQDRARREDQAEWFKAAQRA